MLAADRKNLVVLGYELERRRAIRDLQIREYEHPFLWWPKFLLMLFVCLYWAARFLVKLVGLDDFNVAIAELSQTEAVVSCLVPAYMFLGNKLEMVRGSKSYFHFYFRTLAEKVRAQAATALEAGHLAGQSERGGTMPDHGFV